MKSWTLKIVIATIFSANTILLWGENGDDWILPVHKADDQAKRTANPQWECEGCHTSNRLRVSEVSPKSSMGLWSSQQCYGCHLERNLIAKKFSINKIWSKKAKRLPVSEGSLTINL